MKNYWNKALSFESYLDLISEKTVSEAKQNIQDKYFAALERSKYIVENYVPSTTQIIDFQKKDFNGKILIIAEGWCGDCSQTIPVINKFFKDKNPVKIIFRDENQELMKQFLTNGNEAIPIVIFINEEDSVIAYWGPRTKAGTEILLNHKKSTEKFNKNAFLTDLHDYYDSNKGYDIMHEILDKISSV